MSTYFCLLTVAGQAAVANAVALNQAVALAQMAVGDGGGLPITPQAAMTGLVGEVYRAQANTIFVNPDDPGHVIAELVIPNNQGGWTVREVGLIDADGNLFAVGSVPASVKPATGEGAGAEMTVRMHLVMSAAEAGAIQIKVDPTVVLATRQYVVQSIADHAAAEDAHPDKAAVDHTHDEYAHDQLNITVHRFGTNGNAYNKPESLVFIVAEVRGAGGGGAKNTTYGGGGGGQGARCRKVIRAGDLAAAEPIVIGAGGAAVTGDADGIAGGASSFAGMTASGGAGGYQQINSFNGGSGGAGGTGVGGDINERGQPGSEVSLAPGSRVFGGRGGGRSGGYGASGSPGGQGLMPGDGGGGTWEGASSGRGADGEVIIYAFTGGQA